MNIYLCFLKLSIDTIKVATIEESNDSIGLNQSCKDTSKICFCN